MFEIRLMKRTSGHMGKDKRGRWKQKHNWELHYLSSPIVVRVIKARMVKWVWYIARRHTCMWEAWREATREYNTRSHINKYDRGCGKDLSGSGEWPVVNIIKKPSESTTDKEFLVDGLSASQKKEKISYTYKTRNKIVSSVYQSLHFL
jgi:hypothetical protein